MTARPTANSITHAHAGDDTVTLSYDARFLRRRVLTTAAGRDFLVDLEHTTSLDAGDAFQLDDGRRVAVVAAPEALYEVRGTAADLIRLAWHIGNRHTPCQIEPDRLLIQRDHVIADMLRRMDECVRIARRHADDCARVEKETESYLLAEARAHGCQLSEDEMRSILSLDLELNAQGLVIWAKG